MLNISVDDLGELVVLHCAGRIVSGDEHALLCAVVQHHGRTVALDLSLVEAIDAAGIGALVSLQAAGIYLKLVNPPAVVKDVLRVTKLDSVFEISETAAQPLSSPNPLFPHPSYGTGGDCRGYQDRGTAAG